LEEKYPTYVGSKGKEEEYEDYYQDEDDAHSTVSAFARTSLIDDHEIRKRNSSRSTSPHKPYNKSSSRHHHRPIAPRSRWHQIVLHASSAAGTTAAVISEESMKCLKYCLSWLQVRMKTKKKKLVNSSFLNIVRFSTYRTTNQFTSSLSRFTHRSSGRHSSTRQYVIQNQKGNRRHPS
jgi:hypothetical protein